MSTSTLTVSVAVVTELIISGEHNLYAPLTVGEKASVRKILAESLRAAIGSRDLAQADLIMAAESGITTKIVTKAPVDHQSVLQDRINVLQQAAQALLDGHLVPDGLDVDSITYSDLFSNVPAIGDLSESVRKLATAKITKSGNQYDVGAHLRQVAAQHTSGTFLTVAQIASTVTDECPDGYPHQGAVAARLFPVSGTCTVSEVTADREGGTSNGRRGMIVN